MDLCMDIDSDDMLENEHPLCEFATLKLKSIQDANQQLCTTIEGIKCSIENAAAVKGAEDSLIVGAVCKKYHNGKWCFIVDVSSLDSTLTHKDFDVSMKWSPIIAPQHTLMMYSNDAKSFVTEANIASELRIIVAFESISFVRHKKYEADAVLFYTALRRDNTNASAQPHDNSGARCGLQLGTFQLAAEEMNSGELEIKNIHLINNESSAVLAALACSSQIQVAMTLPMGVLRDYLVIDCMFRELAFDENKCFLLNANASHLNGCILEYIDKDGVYLATLYTRDQVHLHSVLHHLHSSIKGVTILPLKCKWQLEKQKRAEEDEDEDEIFSSYLHSQRPKRADADVKKFGECLLRQIDSVIDFHRNVVGNKEISPECDVTDEYHAIRNSLTQHERTTDLLYQQLNIGKQPFD